MGKGSLIKTLEINCLYIGFKYALFNILSRELHNCYSSLCTPETGILSSSMGTIINVSEIFFFLSSATCQYYGDETASVHSGKIHGIVACAYNVSWLKTKDLIYVFIDLCINSFFSTHSMIIVIILIILIMIIFYYISLSMTNHLR